MQSPLIVRELEAICAALIIQSENTYLFRGELQQLTLPEAVESDLAPLKDARHDVTLADHLRDLFYYKCYVRDYAIERGSEWLPEIASQGGVTATSSGEVLIGNLTEHFIRANQTMDSWDHGWIVYQVNPDGRVSVQKADRSRAANPGEFTQESYTGIAPQIGDMVSLRTYPGSGDLQASFFFAFSSTLTDQFDEFALIRFYFNVKAQAAPALLFALSGHLNRYAIPYRFKSLVEAQMYSRADAAVLYVAKRYYHLVASILNDLRAALADQLREETPMFCHTLMDGVGVADDPRTGESFGMHRCRLVAEGIVDAWEAGSQTVEARLLAIRERFVRDGFSVEKPYLNPRSKDVFAASVFLGANAQ